MHITLNPFKRIPESYRAEFIEDQVSLIKSRVLLFCVMSVGIYFLSNLSLIYSNCGHPGQYIYRVTKADIQRLDSNYSILGVTSGEEEVFQNRIDFSAGDKILLFTDGVLEARDKDGNGYGESRLESFILRNRNLQVELFNKGLLEELNAFKHGSFQDDIFIVNIHIKG